MANGTLREVRGLLVDLIDKLSGDNGSEWAEATKKFLRKENPWDVVKHVVDCDAKPFIPDGWEVQEHKKGGQLKLDLSQIKLHFSPNQTDGRVIEGNKLRKELATEPVLNANVLDYLLAHQELIPEDWKRDANGNPRYIFFWGTIYRGSHGSLYVRYLDFDDGAWNWSFYWLDGDWRGSGPSAVLAS